MRSRIAMAGVLVGLTGWQVDGSFASSADLPTRQPATWIVEMRGGRFAPYELTIAKGDTVRFVLGPGGPHNVAFRELSATAAAQLRKRMGRDTIGDLSGPLLVSPGDTYDIVFADVAAEKYPYWCIPHFAMGQMGTITVK